MSPLPSGPGARPKYSVPASHESDGRVSPAAVLTAVPRLVGEDHGSSALSRKETQMSCPCEPVRFDEKTTSRPSLRTFGWMSFEALLSPAAGDAGPKLPSAPRALTKMSPGTAPELLEK